jgi:prepilin-type processing-associated H-X9-DG protein
MDKSYAIFKCPSVSGDELGYETTVHFGFNGRLNRLSSNDAGKIVAMDYGKEIIDWSDDAEWNKYDTEWTGSGLAPLRRHFDACNVAFFDGHVERTDPDTIRHGKSHENAFENAVEYWAPELDEKKYVKPVSGSGDGDSSGAWDGPQVPIPNIVGGGEDTGGGGESSKYYPQIDANDPGRKFTYDNKYYGEEEDRLIECDFVVILDDGGSSFVALTGEVAGRKFQPWGNGNAKNRSYGNTVHERTSKYLWYAGEFTKTGLENGKYRVSITWPIEWNTSDWASKTETSVPVSVSSGGAAPQATTVDQTQPPSSFDDPEGNLNGIGDIIKWEDIGEVDVTDGKIVVHVGPCDNSWPGGKKAFADAIRIECLELD